RENQNLQEQLRALEDIKNENAEFQSEHERFRRMQDSEAQQIQMLGAANQKLRELDAARLAQMRALMEAKSVETMIAEVNAAKAAQFQIAEAHAMAWLGVN